MMKYVSRNKKALLVFFVLVLSLISIFYYRHSPPQRKLASVEKPGDPMEEVSMDWRTTEDGVVLRVSDYSDDFCERWPEMQVTFRAEGIAYSGEVDQVVQLTNCENGGFQQSWPTNLKQSKIKSLRKKGMMLEEPPQWIFSEVKLKGIQGEAKMNARKISEQYGDLPRMKPR